METQGVELQPWSGLDETYEQFYRLLRERRDDPALWEPLGGLLGEILYRRQRPQGAGLPLAPRSELLSQAEIDGVIRGMREALPGNDAPLDMAEVRRYAAGLPSAALGGFLALGLAATGCDWSENCQLQENSTVWVAVDDSELTYNERRAMCGCGDNLREDWDAGLTELFEVADDEQIAAVLEELVECCQHNEWVLEEPYDYGIEVQLVEQSLCYTPEREPPPPPGVGQPMYKGVAFLS